MTHKCGRTFEHLFRFATSKNHSVKTFLQHLPARVFFYSNMPVSMFQAVKYRCVSTSSFRAKSATNNHISYVMEHRKPRKVVTLDEAMNARPPLRIDLDGPSMCSYSPNNKPLNETNSPVWSFGRRTYVEKGATRQA